VDVTWTTNSWVFGYDVEPDGDIVATGFTGTTYHDSGLNPGRTYSYRVRSIARAADFLRTTSPWEAL
jgi:hypothetical protein